MSIVCRNILSTREPNSSFHLGMEAFKDSGGRTTLSTFPVYKTAIGVISFHKRLNVLRNDNLGHGIQGLHSIDTL